MKSFVKIGAVLCLAAVCVGYAFSQVVAKEEVQTKWFVEVAHSGDRFNNIIKQYYDPGVNDSWDTWQTQQKQYNEGLFANGRALQPGDKILIVTKVRIAK